MIRRDHELRTLKQLLQRYPVVALIGARQVGKTTLARTLAGAVSIPTAYYDLENPVDVARLGDPLLALSGLRGLVIIDEIQRAPELFPVLRVLADRRRTPARFLILGSAAPALIQRSSESLAGRIHYHELNGFSLDEVGVRNLHRLWIRGGFPDSYVARSPRLSAEWRTNFIRTFLERDLPQLGSGVRSTTVRRFWTMLAHYHGQTWNASEVGRSFGVADTTVRNYLDLLTSAMVVRQLLPWHENIGKRQVKSPKVYVADTGLLHTLLNLTTLADVDGHPKSGASWEGFVIAQVIRHLGARPEECFFWATHAGAELDLLVVRGRERLGFEVKRASAPALTLSMRHALADLKLRRLTVLHAGGQAYDLDRHVRALPVTHLFTGSRKD